MGEASQSYLEDTIVHQTSCSSGSYSPSAPYSSMFPDPRVQEL